MSLNSWTTSQLIWKQVKWKCKAFSQSFITLIGVLIVIQLLGWNGSGSSGGGFNQFSVYINIFSLDMNVLITCMWAFVQSLLMQGRVQHQDDYSFVTNRFVTNVSNAIVVIIYSFIATLIAMATLYISTVVIQLFRGIEIIRDELIVNPVDAIVIFLIILLIAAIGFFIGSAFHLSKLLGIGVIVLFIIIMYRLPMLPTNAIQFFFDGGDLLFILKAVVSSILIFGLSIQMLNRNEVTRR
ncbi:hypothetical protein [Ureibacillus manganicus]|uniref:Uncharacterized protein n=1 Tax=Ureibacillus manganicus DSM 26584 TaxID=1384049 RepID=A0A0A3HWU0_9BACL|nr:hypothetical protein [Ureibacillus manganicus]KGR75685.1 hypothetical protein CD29_17790 [Ureibacillus manganicus DSM 26584]